MSTEPPIIDGSSADAQNANNNGSFSQTKQSVKSGGTRKSLPSPLTSAKNNSAADSRNMRRIIAEDPNWSLATVPLLTELCVKHIVDNFAEHPKLNELLPKYKDKVLEKISTNLPLSVVSHLVCDEGYWQRRCKATWNVCDVSKYQHNWKRMFFERHIEYIIEHFVPETTEETQLNNTLPLASPYIWKLDLKQLLPPVKEEPNKIPDDVSDVGSESGLDTPSMDHFEFSTVFDKLPHLQEFSITYGVRDCGMNFEWNLFMFTNRDCLLLSKCIKKCRTLKVFKLHRSKVDDDKTRVLIAHILDHPSLSELDLSHNMIADSGARAIGKFINGRCKLTKLNLSNNKIRANGAAAIGHALSKNTTLKLLDMKLNRIGDDGGQAICQTLTKNTTLENLNLGSNELSEPTAAVLAQIVIHNTTLKYIDLSCNRLGPDGGKQIQEGLEENTTLLHIDLRLTEVGQESEYSINQMLKRNQEMHRELKVQKEQN
ncbi:dynein regulatory complex subunit 5-like [Antedon mediterranea]|uniref:dynein regulatory complex subunit 5-like n=1 Tax=Antedon mediterranea TaxID=105859 RepID=UPI003AF96992